MSGSSFDICRSYTRTFGEYRSRERCRYSSRLIAHYRLAIRFGPLSASRNDPCHHLVWRISESSAPSAKLLLCACISKRGMTSSGGIAQEKPNMKFSVLALDYDGTIARDGQLDPEVRSAIGEVRSRGIVVVIVTGRTISDLTMVAGGLDFVDAVVGENGAVLAFPSGNTRL